MFVFLKSRRVLSVLAGGILVSSLAALWSYSQSWADPLFPFGRTAPTTPVPVTADEALRALGRPQATAVPIDPATLPPTRAPEAVSPPPRTVSRSASSNIVEFSDARVSLVFDYPENWFVDVVPPGSVAIRNWDSSAFQLPRLPDQGDGVSALLTPLGSLRPRETVSELLARLGEHLPATPANHAPPVLIAGQRLSWTVFETHPDVRVAYFQIRSDVYQVAISGIDSKHLPAMYRLLESIR